MKGLSYKWLVLITVIFGLFMVMLDTTIVNIAIPSLQADFGAALTDVGWVATGYTLAEGTGIPLTPFFLALLGNKRFYLTILGAFTLGSMLCGLAWSLPTLVVFRILQGIAGASMIPMSINLLFAEFPPQERGVAMGFLGIPLLLAPALGPSLGGYLVTFVSWRVLFYVNVPVGILGFFMASLLLRESQSQGSRHFDLPGFLFSTVGMASLLYALSSAGSDGWGSAKVLSFLALGLFSLVVFVVVELLTIQSGKQPLLDLRVFGVLSFTSGNLAMMMTIFALFGGLFLVPLYLQNLRGLSAYQAGMVLLPQALGTAVASAIGGRLADRVGVKTIVIPGLLIFAGALWGFSHLTQQTPLSTFQILLIIRGLGQGLCMQPVVVAAMAQIKPAQLAQASTLNSVVRSVTSALGVAVIAPLVTARTTFHYVRLAEQVTAESVAGQALQLKAAYFASRGMTQHSALAAAIEQTIKQVQQQAYLLAMNDAFLLTLGTVCIAMLIVLLLIRSPRKKVATASVGEERKGSAKPLADEQAGEEPVMVH